MEAILFVMVIVGAAIIGGAAFDYDAVKDVGLVPFFDAFQSMLVLYGVWLALACALTIISLWWSAKPATVAPLRGLLTCGIFTLYGLVPLAFLDAYESTVISLEALFGIAVAVAMFLFIVARQAAVIVTDTVVKRSVEPVRV